MKTNFSTPDYSISSESSLNTNSLKWQQEIEKIGARYLRIHISQVENVSDGIILELRDRRGHVVREYSGSDLRKSKTFWTGVIPGDYVLISLFSPVTPVGFKLIIDQVAYQAYAGAPLSTFGDTDDKESIAAYVDHPIIGSRQRSVAWLNFIKDSSPYTCTGFIIGPGRLLTNHHCINDEETCKTTVAVFGYQYDKNGLLHFGEEYECTRVIPEQTNYNLDYSILVLNGKPETKWGTLALAKTDPPIDKPMFLIQHPGGESKQIAKKNCKINAIPVDGRSKNTDFTHTCDTIKGSSGAPMFNEDGDVIGLHHYGFGDDGKWSENRAIRMNRILEVLE